MSRLTTDEEIAIIDGAIATIRQQKQAIADLRTQLADLPGENEALKAALAAADAADAQADERLSELGALVNPPAPDPIPDPDGDDDDSRL